MIALVALTAIVLLVALALGYLANTGADPYPPGGNGLLPRDLDFSRYFPINENGPRDADTSEGPTTRR